MPTVEELNEHPALLRIEAYGKLCASELKALMSLVTAVRRIPKGGYVCREGERSPGLYLLMEGWAASSVSTEQSKRQLLKLHLIGDLIGLPGLPYDTAPDTVVALTAVTLGRIDLHALGALFRTNPRLAVVLFMISQEERAMLMERLFLIGGQDAAGRFSGLVLQLYARMLRQSPELGNTIPIPLTQADFADFLGITTIHFNRTVAELRRRKILTWHRGRIVIHDEPAMRQLSGLQDRSISQSHNWIPSVDL